MNKLLLLMMLSFPVASYAEDIRVCEAPDGTLNIVVWTPATLLLPRNQRPTPDDLKTYSCEDRDRADLPADRSRRDAWRKKANGKIVEDATIQTKQEKHDADKTAARNKLKALGLTDKDLDSLQ